MRGTLEDAQKAFAEVHVQHERCSKLLTGLTNGESLPDTLKLLEELEEAHKGRAAALQLFQQLLDNWREDVD